ncbi:hypothetical protein Tco_0371028 [Tanacetum coccineum]
MFLNVDQLEKALKKKIFSGNNQESKIQAAIRIDAHANDADIKPIYDEEPMAEVQLTAEINVFATRQQHTEQPEFNNEG